MPKRAIGIDISDASIEAVAIEDGEEPRIVALARVELPEGLVVRGSITEPLRLGDILKELLEKSGIGAKEAVVNLPESRLLTHWFAAPATKEGKITRAVAQEAAVSLPYQLPDLVVDFQTVAQKPQTEVFIAAIPKEVLDALKAVLARAGLEPYVFDIESLALARAFGIAPKAGEVAALVDIGTRTTIVSVFTAEGLRATANVPAGGAMLTESLHEKLGITPEKAEAIKQKAGLSPEAEGGRVFLILQRELQSILREVLALVSGEERRSGVKGASVTLAGGGALLPGLAKYVSSALDRPTVIGEVKGSAAEGDAVKLFRANPLLFANAVGLAMRGLQAKGAGLSFLRREGTIMAEAARPAAGAARAPRPRGAGRAQGRKWKIIMAAILVAWLIALAGVTVWYFKYRQAQLRAPAAQSDDEASGVVTIRISMP